MPEMERAYWNHQNGRVWSLFVSLSFQKTLRITMEYVAGEQGLSPNKSS